MESKNSKSESYIVREAENIIEDYLRDRQMSNIKNYHNLKEKYDRLKILAFCVFLTSSIGILLNIIIK